MAAQRLFPAAERAALTIHSRPPSAGLDTEMTSLLGPEELLDPWFDVLLEKRVLDDDADELRVLLQRVGESGGELTQDRQRGSEDRLGHRVADLRLDVLERTDAPDHRHLDGLLGGRCGLRVLRFL